MTLTISIIAVVLLVFFIVFRQSLAKKKYQDTTYLSNLKQIAWFFDTIQTFSDSPIVGLVTNNFFFFLYVWP